MYDLLINIPGEEIYNTAFYYRNRISGRMDPSGNSPFQFFLVVSSGMADFADDAGFPTANAGVYPVAFLCHSRFRGRTAIHVHASFGR